MLRLFKQPESEADSRQRLLDVCNNLAQIGQRFNLDAWGHLIETAKQAIASPDNPYRTLAPIVIKDIKQAQDLVLAGRASEVSPCAQLQELAPIQPSESIAVGDDFADLLASADDAELELDLFGSDESSSESLLFENLDTADAVSEVDPFVGIDFEGSLTQASSTAGRGDRNGPEVGMAELNSLADLFEGEVPDLGSTWQEEEIIGEEADILSINAGESSNDFDASSDFSDLLFEETEISQTSSPSSSSSDLSDLFGDDLLDEDDSELESVGLTDSSASSSGDDLEDLLAMTDLGQPAELNFEQDTLQSVDSPDPFGDLELNQGSSVELSDVGLDLDFSSESEPSLNNDLGELFAGMDDTDLALSNLSDGAELNSSASGLDDLENPFIASSTSTDEPLATDLLGALDSDLWAETTQSEPATEGQGSIADFGDESDLGSLFGESFAAEPDPTLEELSDQGTPR